MSRKHKEINASFGARLKELRLKKRWTQSHVGMCIGIKDSAVAKYENGEVGSIPMPALETLSEIFSVSIDYLITGKEPVNADFERLISCLYRIASHIESLLSPATREGSL